MAQLVCLIVDSFRVIFFAFNYCETENIHILMYEDVVLQSSW